MPRSSKISSERLTEVLPPIRCTKAEKEQIKAQSVKANLSLSQYIRQMALDGKINIRESDTDFQTMQQLRKLGVNLNQQTRKLNATGTLPYELKVLWRKLDLLLDQLLKGV